MSACPPRSSTPRRHSRPFAQWRTRWPEPSTPRPSPPRLRDLLRKGARLGGARSHRAARARRDRRPPRQGPGLDDRRCAQVLLRRASETRGDQAMKARNGAGTVERRGALWWVQCSLPKAAVERKARRKRVPIADSEKMTELQAKRAGARL